MNPIPTTLFALFCLLAPAAAQGGKPAEKPAGQEPAKKEEPKKKEDPKKGEKQDKKADAKTDGKAADKVDFAAQVWPILEKNCLECHKAAPPAAAGAPQAGRGRKRGPKGGVSLDSKEGMQKSKKGKLIVASKPDDSLLVHSISLPADDEDRMPPKDKHDPLAQADIDLIKKWVEQGAEFGSWTAAEAKTDGKSEEKPADDKGEKGDGEKSGGEKDGKSDKGGDAKGKKGS